MKKFIGIVEDRFDPEGRGRVRVRINELHSGISSPSNFQGFTTQELPWFEVVLPPTAGTISGVGQSPKGLIEGTRVEITYNDDDLYDGRVSGIIAAAKLQNSFETGTNGFKDPTGLYPEQNNQSDTNSLSGFDYDPGKSKPGSVQKTNSNLGLALRPDGTIATEENLDDNPNYTLYEMIRREEGWETKAYMDSQGFPTIGVGHLIKRQAGMSWAAVNKELSSQIGRDIKTTGGPGSINPEEVEDLFSKDLITITKSMNKYPGIVAAMTAAGTNNPRKWALISMAFQMGPAGLAKFSSSLALMASGQWKEASLQIKQSKWAQQTPARAQRTSIVLSSGNMLAYGVPITERNLRARVMALSVDSLSLSDFMCEDWIYEAKMAAVKAAKEIYKKWLKFIGVVEGAIDDIAEQLTYAYNYAKLMVAKTLEEIEKAAKWVNDKVVEMIDYVQKEYDKLEAMVQEKADAFIEWGKGKLKELTNGFNLPEFDNKCDPKDKKSRSRAVDTNNPWDEQEPNTSPIMFLEPESSWASRYPYNNVTVTEGGHIIEIDDTPGQQRMHWQSASGIYSEWRPDASRVTKVPEDDFKFIGSDMNTEVSGNQNTNVMGAVQTYILGDSKITVASNGEWHIYGNNNIVIQGNQDVFIKGNQNVKIEGNQTVGVTGNVVINVEGTSTINNKGDVTLNAEANVNANVKGNMTQEVDGDWNVNAKGNINLIATGQTKIDGSRIDLG